MIDEPTEEIVRVIEGGDMDINDIQDHLAQITDELKAVASSFNRVSLLIDATNKNFTNLQARKYWSAQIRKLPKNLPYYRMAFVVTGEDVEAANSYTSDKPWFGTFTSMESARQWLKGVA